MRLGRVVDKVGETRSQRLVLAAAAAAAGAFLLGVASYPPFVGVRPVYPGVHRLLPPGSRAVRRRRLGVGRARSGDDDCLGAPLVPVEEGREGGRGRGRRHGKCVW